MDQCMEKDLAVCGERMSCVSIADNTDPLVCPKPRRLGPLNNPVNDSKAAIELLDIIFSRGGHGVEHSINHVNSSPPFYCGSPPSRATNPLVQDAHFGDKKVMTSSPLSINLPSHPSPSSSPSPSLSPSPSPSPSSFTRKGGCARAKLGHKPATVRIEGFDCLNRDRRNCSIPAVA